MIPIQYIGGTSGGVGKTFVSLGLLHELRKQHKVGAWKPVDVGQVAYNANDELSDGEHFQQVGAMEESVNLINPYLLNEDLPPVLAAQRDGIQVDAKLIQKYAILLSKRYDRLLIEGTRGLLTPLHHIEEKKTETPLDWLKQVRPRVIWVTTIGERALSETLTQVTLLQQHQIDVQAIILSNRDNVKHGDLIHYQWVTLEQQLSVRVVGLLPFLNTGLNEPDKIGELLKKHLEKDFWENL